MVKVTVFDAVGTLLDVNSPMRTHAARLGPDWQRISQDWRTKHIDTRGCGALRASMSGSGNSHRRPWQ